MGELAPGHLIVLVTVIMLVFGSKRIPEIARGLGTGMREFRSAIAGEDETPVGDAAPGASRPRPQEGDAATRDGDADGTAHDRSTPAA